MMPGRQHHHGHPPLRTETALGVLLACVIGALLAIAMVSWMLCSQSTDAALCTLAVPALPVRNALRRWWLQWLMWRNTRRMRETQRQIDQYRRLLAHDKLEVLALEARMARQQAQQLALASEQ